MAIIQSIIKKLASQNKAQKSQIQLVFWLDISEIESDIVSNIELGLFEVFWLDEALCQVCEINSEGDFEIITANVIDTQGNTQDTNQWCTGQKVNIEKLDLELGFIPSYFAKESTKKSDMTIKVATKQNLRKDTKKYDFIPVTQNGDYVNVGDKIGYISLSSEIKYWILANQNGQISQANLNSFEQTEPILFIDNQPSYLDSQSLKVDQNVIDQVKTQIDQSPNIYSTDIASLDIFYPVLSSAKTLLINPPKALIKDLINPLHKTQNRITLHLAKGQKKDEEKRIEEKADIQTNQQSNPQVIKIIDNIAIPTAVANFVQNWCIKLTNMGYEVLVINELGYFLDLDTTTTQIVATIEILDILGNKLENKTENQPIKSINEDYYHSKIVWQGNDLDWGNSNSNNFQNKFQTANLEKVFLSKHNIQRASLYQKLSKTNYQKLPESIKKIANYPQTNSIDKLVNQIATQIASQTQSIYKS